MEDKWDKANKVADATKDPSSDDIELASIESKKLDETKSLDEIKISEDVSEPVIVDE